MTLFECDFSIHVFVVNGKGQFWQFPARVSHWHNLLLRNGVYTLQVAQKLPHIAQLSSSAAHGKLDCDAGYKSDQQQVNRLLIFCSWNINSTHICVGNEKPASIQENAQPRIGDDNCFLPCTRDIFINAQNILLC
ncbi:MAG: hypothetical protein DWI57_03330 [Chloroflexi bacterium]|nr:MAG: hypothetical protein DWI57_03330 [Chloroflexota bacterium]